MKQSKLYTRNEKGGVSFTRTYDKHTRYKYSRHTKDTKYEIENEIHQKPYKKYKSMVKDDSKDYSKLFNYLLTQVGNTWDNVWKDIFPRVDNNSVPIMYMVLNINKNGLVSKSFDIENANPSFIYGTRYYKNKEWSTLYVDNNGILQYINKEYKPNIKYPQGGWTQSFNGKVIYDGTGNS